MVLDTLSSRFFRQAKSTPNNIAITDPDIELTYQQTANQVKYLAQYLIDHGYHADSIISIYSSKRYEIIIAFLAISSIGASCVQLDKSFPMPLLTNIIKDTNSDLLLCDDIPDIKNTKCIDYIKIISQYNQEANIEFKNTIIDPEKNFWLVYSSGTTGRNKGIAISHRAILSSYEIRETIKPYNQDSSIGCNIYYLWEAFRPLIKGGRTNIIPDDILYNFKALANYIKNKKINEMLFTPSYLETLLSSAEDAAIEIFNQLQTCWLNGEVVSSWLQHNLEKFMAKTNIYNLYSISECHDVAVYKLHKNDQALEKDGIVPVGHVLPKVEAIVLDENKNIVKNNANGEVYIHAIGLANEYINRPDLNKERFISASDSPIGKRLYKTGDYGKLSKDGQLITIYGRCDYIIKLRGYTLSLPFIESVIKDKLDVMHCVVNKTGEKRMTESLVAYLEIPSNKQADFCNKWDLKNNNKPSKKLLDKISPHLAQYMLPKYILLIDKIPLNRYSNKLDRNNLKLEDHCPANQNIENINTLENYQALWANVLGISLEHITHESSFFELGGSSLSAMLLIAKLNDLGFNIQISDFIQRNKLKDSYSLLIKKDNSNNTNITQEILADIDNLFDDIKPRAILDEKITHPENILITGATGFLGSHILSSLISNKQVKTIFCLVRATEQYKAKSRIQKILKKLNTNPTDKIVYLTGDISKKDFGWQINKYQKLSKKIDTIIHCAANVNLLLPYSSLRASNLIGTATTINFCLENQPKHLIHISTNGIFPLHLDQKFDESEDINWLNSLQSGYSQSKWAAEKLIHKAVKKGLNATILRLGNIAPLSSNYINSSDTNWLLLQEITSQKKIPKNINLEMTPVDHIAKIIEYIMTNKQSSQYIYNITNKNLLGSQMLSKIFNYEVIPNDKWFEMITNDSVKYLAADKANINSAHNKYEQSNYKNLMKNLNINYPQITKIYLNKILKGKNSNEFS